MLEATLVTKLGLGYSPRTVEVTVQGRLVTGSNRMDGLSIIIKVAGTE